MQPRLPPWRRRPASRVRRFTSTLPIATRCCGLPRSPFCTNSRRCCGGRPREGRPPTGWRARAPPGWRAGAPRARVPRPRVPVHGELAEELAEPTPAVDVDGLDPAYALDQVVLDDGGVVGVLPALFAPSRSL